MSLITILETLFIGPLKLIFEIIFVIAERVIKSSGLSIIALSLVINVLMLPLHRRADAMQEEARDKEAKLRDGIAHIKKTFTGDERMMILQTYYRQNDYRPTEVLNGSVSLLLEVPFFMAAYQFLSNLTMLNGQSFGPIANLGAPDGMLVIGGIAINVLPILMTLINILSGMVYSKGFPLKTKIQMYGLAVFFLVVLYGSPSGLVFYWTLNNLFSLVKNIYRKYPAVGRMIFSVGGIGAVIFALVAYRYRLLRLAVLVAAGLLCQIPMLLPLFRGKIKLPEIRLQDAPNKKLFLTGSVFLTILTGLLIPSTYIAASPLEYVYTSHYHDPLLYIVMATCLAAGTFLVWMGVFYWLANSKAKTVMDKVVWILCGTMLVNYMFFGRNLGMIYSNLTFAEIILRFTDTERYLNLLVMVLVCAGMYFIACKWSRKIVPVLLAAAIALGGMSVLNVVTIEKETKPVEETSLAGEIEIPTFRLSKEGKNVVVVMLDRAVGLLVPYIFNEKPELVEKFDGFTHYPNTISYGQYTVFGSPALTGGYEYTPVEMNKRSDELLIDKHNEALKVVPVLFMQNGYETTVLDPVYANYSWIPDLSIFDEYPEINRYNTNGLFLEDSQVEAEIHANYRNFFCFSLMKTAPVFLQDTIYYNGTYNQAYAPENLYKGQTAESVAVSTGYDPAFTDEYSILCNMSTMTQVVDEDVNTYMFIDNNATHEPMLLQAPEYVPAPHVDNRAYEEAHADRFTLNGRTLNITTVDQMSHYHINAAALTKLGEWFDYLRENDVYDNTRIIIVADHGRRLDAVEEMMFDLGERVPFDVTRYNPLLMVKDFSATGFQTSDEFMTNADVPLLSVEGLIENPTNPFTGKLITNTEKYDHEQLITRSIVWGTLRNQGTTFPSSKWVSIKDDIWNRDNWSFSKKAAVLTEHELP